MVQPFLSIIIPAYNEAERLPLTLVEMDKHLSGAPYSCEILVVDDGSEDKTAEITNNLTRLVKNLKLIHNDENKGKGAAVRQGMLLAKGAVRMFTDADHPAHISQIDNLLPYFSGMGENKYDVVVCSRLHKESKIGPMPFFISNPAETAHNLLFARPFLVKEVNDIYGGMKLFSGEAAEQIFMRSLVSGWGFDAEILALARAMNLCVKEVPVIWSNDNTRNAPISRHLRNTLEIIKIRWWLNRDRYKLTQ